MNNNDDIDSRYLEALEKQQKLLKLQTKWEKWRTVSKVLSEIPRGQGKLINAQNRFPKPIKKLLDLSKGDNGWLP